MNFGDLLSYARPGYTHWAVYTGKNENGKDTVVEFTGEVGSNSKAGATVKQGLLKPGFTVENQWHGQTAKPDAEMRANVEKVLRDGAGKYGVLDNNCEHLATFIRYGETQSLQANRVLNTASDSKYEVADNFGVSSLAFSPNMKFK
ncbi:phospholipase A and acyltransferase 1-like [Onychostoma macrolepis]|nr:phospholipase A and acyltransferase 1-like [Onychostoma macrolepis]